MAEQNSNFGAAGMAAAGSGLIGSILSYLSSPAQLAKRYDRKHGTNTYDQMMLGMTGAGLTTAQIQQNQINADQAMLQRQWAAGMSSTEIQRRVADAQAAGINPTFAIAGSGAGASSPSGAAASGGVPAGPHPVDIVGLSHLAPLIEAISNAALAQSQIRKNDAEAEHWEIDNMSLDERNNQTLRLWEQQTSESAARTKDALQRVETGKADEALKKMQVTREEAQADLLILQAVEQNITNANKQKLIDLQMKLTQSQIDINSAEYDKIQAEIGKIYAETITESYKQGNLAADTSKKFAEIGLIGEQTEHERIDNQYRALSDKVQIGVQITQGLKNTADAAETVVDIFNPFKKLFKRGAGVPSK